jgi:hypothetical protein
VVVVPAGVEPGDSFEVTVPADGDEAGGPSDDESTGTGTELRAAVVELSDMCVFEAGTPVGFMRRAAV